MIYLPETLSPGPGAVVQTTQPWGQLGLRYWSRAPVIVGSNPTRPTTDPLANYYGVSSPAPSTSIEASMHAACRLENSEPYLQSS